MNNGIVVGGVAMVVVTAGAVTGLRSLNAPGQAQVLAVKDVMQTVSTPQQRCEEVQVQRQAPVQDERRVAGAAAGAYAGNQVQKKLQQGDTTTVTETRCKTVQLRSQKLLGHDVTYRLDGKETTVRMDHKPGKTLPVHDGQPVLTAPPEQG